MPAIGHGDRTSSLAAERIPMTPYFYFHALDDWVSARASA
jgi:hypothetical protein